MRFIADLHVHSRFSRATSRDLTLGSLHGWALRKGLTVVGTGDFTHPAWRAELGEQLVPAEPGLYALRDELRAEAERDLPPSCRGPLRFVLQVEVATIYKAAGRTRKVHHVILAPSLAGAEQLATALGRIGNVSSDGRPILGLDSRDLLELVLEHCPGGCLIPAHLWTPWFSALGSMGGFDAVDDCYRDLAGHVFAVETGLSSDPPMNWRVSALDRFALVSNSDAHSPSKLARECNVFDTALSYDGMIDALRTKDPARFGGTIEFFPEEGKYHLDGHRKCGVRLRPAETRAAGRRCPVCGRPVTVGVMHRVEDLADRPEGARPARANAFRSLVGLAETVGNALGVGAQSKRVAETVDALVARLGPELAVLQDAPIPEIERHAGDVVAEAVRRVRAGEVRWEAGYDGEYGRLEIFRPDERAEAAGQIGFFGVEVEAPAPPEAQGTPELPFHKPEPDEARQPELAAPAAGPVDPLLDRLGEEQRAAVLAPGGAPLLVIAGPGTGKTRTLTARVALGVREGRLDPARTLALTFTNRAAKEMAERLAALLGGGADVTIPTVATFHAYGLSLLRAAGLARSRIVDDAERIALVAQALEATGSPSRRPAVVRVAEAISRLKSCGPLGPGEPGIEAVRRAYDAELERADADDFDDLVLRAAEAVERRDPHLPGPPRAVFVDEYQDLNPSQVRLLRALVAAGESELFAIGDPDQAIYGFRGADATRIVEFERDWPGARVLTLGRSYRSSDTILEAAGQVIARAQGRDRPRLWSGLDGEPHLIVLTARSVEAEAERIALLVERLLGGTSLLSFDTGLIEGPERPMELSLGDVAVLYRTRSQGEPIAGAFGRLGLPVQMARGEAGDDEGLATILAALRLLARRASPDEQRRLETAPWAGAVRELAAGTGDAASLGAREALERLAVATLGAPAREVAALAPLLRRAGALDEGRRARAARGPGLARPARAVDDLLDWVALHAEADLADPRAERISLMTLHASKGLEWKVVVIAGCEDGLLPHRIPGAPAGPEALDEERRLFFVGMTRAERLLVLSRAEERLVWGERRRREPSPFLLEIEERYLRRERGAKPRRPAAPSDRQLDLF